MHPCCCGAPGHVDTLKGSRQQFCVPTHVCEEDGPLIMTSYAAAVYRSCVAGHFAIGHSGLNPLKGYATRESAFAALRNSSPAKVVLPAFRLMRQRQLDTHEEC